MIRKIIFIILIAATSLALPAHAPGEAPSGTTGEPAITKERAADHKKRGDEHAKREDFQAAAEEYLQGLAVGRDTFTLEERTQMAVYLSWADRLKEAETELRLVLEEDPERADARVHLARVLSWSGRQGESIQEAEGVLLGQPENRDALLVKANALRWKGEVSKSIPIYTELLNKEEEFDVRLGLTYAFLESGYIDEARQSEGMLEPRYGYQERELEKLALTMRRQSRPMLQSSYRYYNDTDENEYHRFGLSQNYWAGRWKSSVHFRHTAAEDPARKNRADEVWAQSYGMVNDRINAGGGLGLAQFTNGKKREIITGHIRGDLRVLTGRIGATLAEDIISDTAQLIDNRIYFTDAGAYLWQNIAPRLTFHLSYNYRDYSDENSSSNVQLNLRYILFRGKPQITLGVRPRYVDFNRQSGGGYFDPQDFFSIQGYLSLAADMERYYFYLEPFFGHQSFRRFGQDTDETFGGAVGSLGWYITENLSFEASGEGGNFAFATSSGFEYYLVGLSINLSF